MDEATENPPQRQMSEEDLRRKIEDYYLPRQLVEAIFELGEIPESSTETVIGIGFVDIADYSFISKFLSPTENQVVLNGLFTAFDWVLRRHGGYLNKIEGDSMMFQFGGLTDRTTRGLDPAKARRTIAERLFYACVKMQRACALFNEANDRFLDEEADPKLRADLKKAFDIIRTLRTSNDLGAVPERPLPDPHPHRREYRRGQHRATSGPRGRKHWDIIGVPVIEAKRMEATAPIGGLRITAELYQALEEGGVVKSYFEEFRREARVLFGAFRDISAGGALQGQRRPAQGQAQRDVQHLQRAGQPEAPGGDRRADHAPARPGGARRGPGDPVPPVLPRQPLRRSGRWSTPWSRKASTSGVTTS